MSEFGRGYQSGLNSALGQQVSEKIWSGLNKRREQDWVQQQFQALQAQLQAVQLENMRLQQENVRLRQDNAEYERFTNWAMGMIDEQSERIDYLQSTLNKWMNMSL